MGKGRRLREQRRQAAQAERVRTPQQIRDDYLRTGSPEDLALWQEYQQAMQRHDPVEWSPGMRERLAELEGGPR
jgi:hypothetical protein